MSEHSTSGPDYAAQLKAGKILWEYKPIALYWENDDWTCSFRCGVVAGHVYSWFTPYPHRELTLEETQVEADKFWEADHTSTYSVFDTDDEHAPPLGTRCRNPYCEKLLVT